MMLQCTRWPHGAEAVHASCLRLLILAWVRIGLDLECWLIIVYRGACEAVAQIKVGGMVRETVAGFKITSSRQAIVWFVKTTCGLPQIDRGNAW